MEVMTAVARLVADIRRLHPHLDMNALARACGYSRRQMRRYANGRGEAREATLVVLRGIRDSDTVREAYSLPAPPTP
jgi:hypothetical protein